VRSTTASRVLASIAALSLLTAACGGGSSKKSSGGGASTAAAVDAKDCPVDALKSATAPVDITFWHVEAEADKDNLQKLADQFNSSQSKVRVKLVQQPNYRDALQKYEAGLQTGDVPDVMQMEETTLQRLTDSKSTVPVAACVKADKYDLTDFSKRALAYYTVDGVLRSMAWNVSNVAFYYNKYDFKQAGLDPNKPPRTLDELTKVAQQLHDKAGIQHPLALKIVAYVFEYLYAKSGETYVNNGNGRKARSTKANLDNATGEKIWTWWRDMVKSGLASNIGTDPDSIDHFLAIGNHQSSMTFEASNQLGRINAALATGIWKNLEFGLAPLPSLDPNGGVPIGDGSLWIPKHSSAAKRAAAWEWIKFLVAEPQQATWLIEKGSVPTRVSVTKDPQVQALWQKDPNYKVGWDQLQAGLVTNASVGSVIGPYQEVRNAVRDGIVAMLTKGLSPAAALKQAQQQADQAIADYNSRVGG